jgi:hypothetical protein
VYHSVSFQLSRSLAEWARPGSEFGFRPPLYLAYLAGVYRIVPFTDYRLAQAATAILGLLTAVALFWLLDAREGRDSSTIGVWTRCVLPSFVIADAIVMTEPLFSALQMTSLLVLFSAPPSAARMVLLGLLIGGCMLTREPALVYPLFFGVWIWWLSPRPQRISHVATFFVAVGLALLPWLARNQVVWGHVFPLSYTAGSNLHIGNNPAATGAFVDLKAHTPSDIPWGGPSFDRWHRAQAISYIKENPMHFVALGFKKIAIFLFPRFLRDDLISIYRMPENRATTLVSLFSGGLNGLLVLVGIVGLALHRRDAWWWFSLLLCGYSLLATFVAFGHPRFRDATDHLLLYFAAYAVAGWRSHVLALRSGDPATWRRLGFASIVGVYIMVNWGWMAMAKAGSGSGL